MEFYTYIWRDSSGVPFYVGKGKGKRAYLTSKRTIGFAEIYAQGGCTVEIVDEFIHESQAHEHEIKLIAQYGRRDFGGLLINRTDGGEGTSGHSVDAEGRAKMSAAARRNRNFLGKTHSAATRACEDV